MSLDFSFFFTFCRYANAIHFVSRHYFLSNFKAEILLTKDVHFRILHCVANSNDIFKPAYSIAKNKTIFPNINLG